MFAVQFGAPGGVDVLEFREVPRPTPGDDDVIVEFEASTINPADVKIRSGQIRPRGGRPPHTPGYDLVGTVADAGAAATARFPVGTRVLGMSAMAITGVGTWAQYVRLPAGSVAPPPSGIDPAVLAQLPLAGLTALQGIEALGSQPGRSVLVAGAAGAVGALAVALLLARGHRVHALVRSAEQGERLPRDVVVHTHASTVNTVDAVLDTVGLDLTAALSRDGRQVTVVPGSGVDGAELVITRESGAMLAELVHELELGNIRLDEPAVFSINDLYAAHDHFERRSGQRTVLVI